MTGEVNRPKKRAVVEMLMSKKPDTVRDVQARSGGRVRKNVSHFVFGCPLNDNCKCGGSVSFEKSTGYTNPFKHLVACVSDGDVNHLYTIYQTALSERRRGGITSHAQLFQNYRSATEKEKAMYAYINLVTELSLPVSFVTNRTARSCMKFKSNFSAKYFKEILFALTELVEREIGRTMADTTGAILHDGWTNCGTHYFGVCASFMKKVSVVRQGVEHGIEEHSLPLLSVSPMAKVTDGESEFGEEATEFDAVTHVRHIEDVFH